MEQQKTSVYAPVNGLQMYYEIKGAGYPLLFLGMGFDVAGVTLDQPGERLPFASAEMPYLHSISR